MLMTPEHTKIAFLVRELTGVGIALSAEQDSMRLMELILTKAMELTGADAGTLYTRTDDKELHFEILKTLSLRLHKGGTSSEKIDLPPIPLKDESGRPNRKMVVACCVIDNQTIKIDDAYNSTEYDFSGTRDFDGRFGYKSVSFLAVPMRNHENDIIGVLQLINKLDGKLEGRAGWVIPFDEVDIQVMESLGSQAAVTMTLQGLIEAQRKLFDSFIKLIAKAIDQKSPYTGGHCRRVPVLTTMLARATCRVKAGPLKEFDMTPEDMYELEVAGWLHDCGKITIPEYVMDKSTKLETLYDRIETVETRMEILRRDAIIAALLKKMGAVGREADAVLADDEDLHATLRQLEKERVFLRNCNIGGESMPDEDLAFVDRIAARTWCKAGGEQARLLTEDERENLKIRKGTLTPREREIINGHMAVTIEMLESLPYPKHLRNVPEYAGGHHEKMDGSGFPRGLTRDQMSLQARMMAIADIFEALTAQDRPYKRPMRLSEALAILGRMKLINQIDPDLFDVFVHERVYLEYAQEFLKEEQIDEVDVTVIPGYQPIA